MIGNGTTSTTDGYPIWRVMDSHGRIVSEARLQYDNRLISETCVTEYERVDGGPFADDYDRHVIVITAPEPEWEDNSDYYGWERPLREFRDDLANFAKLVKDGLTARKAMFLAWNREALTSQYKALLSGTPEPEHKMQRLCYGRERLRMPVRERFKKRVCGGHQRYRVMRP